MNLIEYIYVQYIQKQNPVVIPLNIIIGTSNFNNNKRRRKDL